MENLKPKVIRGLRINATVQVQISSAENKIRKCLWPPPIQHHIAEATTIHFTLVGPPDIKMG